LVFISVGYIKAGSAPADSHALDVSFTIPWFKTRLTKKTITAFLASVLPKKYNNPSSDIINVLAGLDQVDAVFTEFVAALDVTVRTGRTCE
jgi:hypothetical protein